MSLKIPKIRSRSPAGERSIHRDEPEAKLAVSCVSKSGAMAVDDSELIRMTWADQRSWSVTAGRLRSSLSRWRMVAGIAAVLGAFLSTLSASLDETHGATRTTVALVGAVALALTPYVLRTKSDSAHVMAWLKARATSEALKSLLFTYLVCERSTGGATLLEKRQRILNNAPNLVPRSAGIAPTPDRVLVSLTADEYVSERVRNAAQNYYELAASRRAYRAHMLREVEFGLGLIAVVIGALSAGTANVPGLAGFGPWVAVLTTAGSAVAAHAMSWRLEQEASLLSGTARRLRATADAWSIDPNRSHPDRVRKLVDECEAAIATENQSWVVEWSLAPAGEGARAPANPA